MAIKKYYAVAVGRQPGIYTRWFGEAGALAQVDGFRGARYKGFATIEAAREFMRTGIPPKSGQPEKSKQKASKTVTPVDQHPVNLSKRMVIYTDGSSLGNPGPGGYGVVIPSDGGDREISGGFRLTTNNRMELLACIVGLEQFTEPSDVALYSDSRYVVDGITKGWARRWKRNGWSKSTGEEAMNIDLWDRLLALCDQHDVHFIWVKGHAGNSGNERCDQLATRAAAQQNLPTDPGYKPA